MWNLRSQCLHRSLTVVSIVELDETIKMYAMGAGKSEWPGSDDGQDNITCLERGAILRPCLDCLLKCETVNG